MHRVLGCDTFAGGRILRLEVRSGKGLHRVSGLWCNEHKCARHLVRVNAAVDRDGLQLFAGQQHRQCSNDAVAVHHHPLSGFAPLPGGGVLLPVDVYQIQIGALVRLVAGPVPLQHRARACLCRERPRGPGRGRAVCRRSASGQHSFGGEGWGVSCTRQAFGRKRLDSGAEQPNCPTSKPNGLPTAPGPHGAGGAGDAVVPVSARARGATQLRRAGPSQPPRSAAAMTFHFLRLPLA